MEINFQPNIDLEADATPEQKLVARAMNNMNIRSALIRKPNADGHMIANGEIAPGFNWVFEDDDVVCCEYIRGTNISVDVMGGEILSIGTRRTLAYNDFIGDPKLFAAVHESRNRGLLCEEKNGICSEEGFGVIFGNVPTGLTHMITREYQARKLRFSQWGKHPKTVDNISTWLKEDLKSNLPREAKIACGIPTHTIQKERYARRPYGLLFIKSDGRVARITCDMFQWYYDEGLHVVKKFNKGNFTKSEWDAKTDAEKEKIRQFAKDERRRNRIAQNKLQLVK